MALVSSTEKSPAIQALGGLSTLPEDYGSDILWIIDDANFWGVQRKTITDFVASASDNRLMREVHQMTALAQGVLIVEGNPSWSLEGKLLGNDYVYWTQQQHYGLIASIQSKGIWYFESRNQEHTAAICRNLMKWSQKPDHKSLDTRTYLPKFGESKHQGYKTYLMQGIPRVGQKKARDLIAKAEALGYDLPIGWRLTVEEIASIDGIGKATAQAIFASLGGAISSSAVESLPS